MSSNGGYPIPPLSKVRINVNQRVPDLAAATWKALADANEPAFLFRIGSVPAVISLNEDATPKIVILNRDAFRGCVERVVEFVGGAAGQNSTIQMPRPLLADMYEAPEKALPSLRGISEVPIYSSRGLLISQNGFDRQTGLFLHGELMEDMAALVDSRDRDWPKRMLAVLLGDVLKDFPFLSHADRANALAAAIQPFARELFEGPSPLFLIESPAPGSGKTLLSKVISLPTAGRQVASLTLSGNEEEKSKTITSLLIDSPAVVLLDNLKDRLDSPALASALTTSTWKGRVLGRSEMVELPVRCTWIATGNNPEMSQEIARRCVRIRIDTGTERPWEGRKFKHSDLLGWITKNRALVAAAMLILIREWIGHGRPEGAHKLGGYESWSKVIGGILDVAGIEGFLENRDRTYQLAENEVPEWTELCRRWWTEFQDNPVAARSILELAKNNGLITDIWSGRGDPAANAAIGKALMSKRDRVFGDYQIQVHDRYERTGARLYRLSKKADDADDGRQGKETQTQSTGLLISAGITSANVSIVCSEQKRWTL